MIKDYFADIIPNGVAGVTRCNAISNPNNTNTYSVIDNITPDRNIRGGGCNAVPNEVQTVLHHATPILNHGVMPQAAEIRSATHVTPGTPDNYYIEYFEERAGIAEFDGYQSRVEAEAIAYKDTLAEWIYRNPPAGCAVTQCAYCGTAIDFSVGGYQAWGDVYLCHHSQDDGHLMPYLQSRIKEAKFYLKTIKINQTICEV